MSIHGNAEEWSLELSNFGFSEKQLLYKCGRELQKDGSHGSRLFFNLATPKQEHFMNHDLSLHAPSNIDGVQIYPRVVDSEGFDLPSIILMIFHEDVDRFISIHERCSFLMTNCSKKRVRYRFETPSKSSMNKAFCVVYDVKDNSGIVIVSSESTEPVLVQTKRGGTTAVTTDDPFKSPRRGPGRRPGPQLTRSTSANSTTGLSSVPSSSEISPSLQALSQSPGTKPIPQDLKRPLAQDKKRPRHLTSRTDDSASNNKHFKNSSNDDAFGYNMILESLDIIHSKVDIMTKLLVNSTSSEKVGSELEDIKTAIQGAEDATALLRKRRPLPMMRSSMSNDGGDEDSNEEEPLGRTTTFGMVRARDLRETDVRAGVASLTKFASLSSGTSINFDSSMSTLGNSSATDISDALILTSISSAGRVNSTTTHPSTVSSSCVDTSDSLPPLCSQDSFILASQDRDMLLSQNSITELNLDAGGEEGSKSPSETSNPENK